jgi:hypothetical protein
VEVVSIWKNRRKKNVDSSSEAFSKFETWKKLKTSLRVTVIIGGQVEDVVLCTIFGVDKDASQVGLSKGRNWARALDLEEAVFSLEGPSRVIAARNESDWLVFEEIWFDTTHAPALMWVWAHHIGPDWHPGFFIL